MKKKTVGYLAIAGALSFGIIGGVGVPAFAATNTPTAEQATKTAKKDLDAATKQKVKTIMDDTKKQLQELGVKLPEKEKRKEMFAGLDEQTKEKAKSILEQEKSGKLTHEQAKEELTKLGVKLPEKEKHEDIFAGLDEATKTKAKAILDNEKKQLEELNVDLPHHKFFMKKEDK
ncbi:hypothetical protein [Bacillus cereus]|uniref:hypothetical protein n=1 Tax=Bacillus cereus TaxID=1396 RepID=UPI000BF98440|nr:hypothetical protein [Bacillus cereus]PFQ13775.1 hypothetical protein COK14_07530 [Bacillus cereus]